MAYTPISGKNVNLYRDESATLTPDWVLYGCLTELGTDGSRDTIDASSKCGSAQLGGSKTETVTFTGFASKEAEADGIIGMNGVAESFDTGDTYHWKIQSDDDGGSFIYREFNGSVTSYAETFNQDDAVGYNGTISVSGDIIRIAPTT